MLLDALEQFADPRLALTLVGDRERDPLHARDVAARIDGSAVLRSCVTTVGPLDDHALAQTMARADALVLPSSLEGYGMVIAEALHAGLAVLAARDAALAAGIGDELAALVFDDGRGLTAAIGRFVEHRSGRAAMHRAAERTKPRRWTDAVAAFEQVVTRAVAAQRARVPDRVPGP
jgi:glycosyltransferase involved in cell wall biosynthesis